MASNEPRNSLNSAPLVRWLRRGLIVLVLAAVCVSAVALLRKTGSRGSLEARLTHTITRGELLVTVTEQGTLESSNNTEIKCKVRGANTITWVIESGTEAKPGDELVRLDTLYIEEQINQRTMYSHLARSGAARSKADLEKARIAVSEYLEGRFVTQLAGLEKALAVAESRLRTAKSMRDHAVTMSRSDYATELDVEEQDFAVAQAKLNVGLAQNRIEVLKQFTKAEELVRLDGDLKAATAQHDANLERVLADEQRLKRAEEEYEHCVVEAERAGMVLYPTAEEWKSAPEIEEGATVHQDQTLLLMPDLMRMQVKVGIHESIVDRIEPGLAATVTLPDKTLDARVTSVAKVAQPAGWWSGNVVKYDTFVELPSAGSLKPGMTAEVEIVIARHDNVLTIPTAAVIETEEGFACWVETADEPERRTLTLGDAGDMFLVVDSGVREGDKVVLDPVASIEEARTEAAMTLRATESGE